jgi:TonB family protein
VICPSCQAENDDHAEVCFTCGTPLNAGFTVTRGTLIGGRYEVLSLLGRGGMGTVYMVRDHVLDETVALKTLRPDLAREPDVVRRFVSETKLARRVRHGNVCAIHEFGEDRGLRFLVMEFVDGTDLRRILKESAPLPPEECFDIALQIARGLRAIHHVGIIHRDLKSPNIMRDARGRVRVMDFGIAKQSGSDTTLGGQVVGTPEYMSPEQARGRKVDFRADLYALGIVVYEIFTGRVPFKGDTPIATILKHLNEPPPLYGEEAAALPPSLVPIIARALAKDPAGRFESADAMLQALQTAFAACCPAAAVARAAGSVGATEIAPRQRLVADTLHQDGSALREPWLPAEAHPTPVPTPTAVPAAAAPTMRPVSDEAPVARSHVRITRQEIAGVTVLLLTTALGGAFWWHARTGLEPIALPPAPGAATAGPASVDAPRVRETLPASVRSAEPPAAIGSAQAATVTARSARPSAALLSPVRPQPGPADTSTAGVPSAPAPADAAVPAAPAPLPTPAPEPAPAAAASAVLPAATSLLMVNPPSRRAAAATTVELVRPGPGVREAESIGGPKPLYPDLARRLRRSARVVVRALVDENGRVAQTEMLEADNSNLGFNESALQAVRSLRFHPALKDGVPARMWVEMPVKFDP